MNWPTWTSLAGLAVVLAVLRWRRRDRRRSLHITFDWSDHTDEGGNDARRHRDRGDGDG